MIQSRIYTVYNYDGTELKIVIKSAYEEQKVNHFKGEVVKP